ncbi:large subunit ribosomal protein L28e [Fistulifera solaris]|jgi:large subunit ribosomal protein L28e|uniref:Large subunit ribosomal protein L28e n=1 Tax=Fistulifera solaris TaxID=1519565 RepID=A0A1Z5JGY5_FISSO|nr:large subunit ribosomal protein L28e [Fistulifera solaris]|eukprot:GAX13186.1 large subunit ribosomal protein L28e [Fistulifera solaris]
MVAIPDQLTWEIVRRNNCFLKKRNGQTKRSGSVQFSVEPGNCKSLNQLKYSAIANSKALDVVFSGENRAQLIKKTAGKSGSKVAVAKINVNKDFRRSEKVIVGQGIDNFYRQDLKGAVLAKYTAVYQANRRAKGITKPVPVKKGRKSSA